MFWKKLEHMRSNGGNFEINDLLFTSVRRRGEVALTGEPEES